MQVCQLAAVRRQHGADALHAAVPDEQFLAGRLEVLAPLLEGDLFRTGKGKALTEAARANLTGEVHELAARLGVPVPKSALA